METERIKASVDAGPKRPIASRERERARARGGGLCSERAQLALRSRAVADGGGLRTDGRQV